MPNYHPSTVAEWSRLKNGLCTSTGTLLAASYLLQNQVELFNLYGRVKIHELFGEVSTIISNTATTLLYNWTSTTPVIAVQPLCAASASMAQLAVGERVAWIGGAVATAAVLTATAGITDVNRTSQIVGTDGGVGTIGILTAGANATSGALKFSVFWSAMSDGAYIEALL